MRRKGAVEVDQLLTLLTASDFLVLVWLFPIAVTIHEFEEWNIVRWYERNFVNLPPLEDRGLRAWIVFSSLLAFAWTALAVLTGSAPLAGFILLLAFALMLQNALQHIFYVVYFRSYAPGVITGVLLLVPIILYLTVRAVSDAIVPGWYALLLIAFTLPNLVQTVRAGNTMLPSLLAVHRFGSALARRF